MAAQRRRTVPAAAWKREEEKKRENPGERRRITVHGDNKGAVSPHRPAAELHLLLLLLRCDACVTPGVRKRRRRSVSGADGTKWSTIVCVEIRMAWMWKRKSLIATSLIVAVSLFVVVVNYTEKSYYLLQPVFGQTFRRPWMFSKPPYKAFKPHLGYISIPTQKPLKLHCELCSIVSSSGQMLGQGAGPEIDRSPCIWRMNNAPTRGFEKDVGRRTTLRVVSHTSVPLLLQKPQYFFGQANDTIYVVWGPLRNMRKDGKGIVYNMLRQAVENYPNARIYVTTEDRMNHCDMVFKKETGKDRIQSGSYLSTGWFTLILAMDMCKEIHIYGMINDTYCKTDDYRKVPYHYYEVGSRDECAEYVLHESAPYGGHRFITEKAVFAKWAKSHTIKFFNPPWQLS